MFLAESMWWRSGTWFLSTLFFIVEYADTHTMLSEAMCRLQQMSVQLQQTLNGSTAEKCSRPPWCSYCALSESEGWYSEHMNRYIQGFIHDRGFYNICERDDGLFLSRDEQHRRSTKRAARVESAAVPCSDRNRLHERITQSEANVSIIYPGYALNVVDPAGTSKTRCAMTALFALFSSDDVNKTAAKVEIAHQQYMKCRVRIATQNVLISARYE